MRILNLIGACAAIQTALHALAADAQTSSPNTGAPEVAALLARIRVHAAQVEAICARSDSNPAQLPTPSRRAYQWLKYLSAPANLLAQLATMSEARRIIAQMAWLKEGELARYAITFELSYGSYLYQARPAGERPQAERNLPRRTAGGAVSNAEGIRRAGERPQAERAAVSNAEGIRRAGERPQAERAAVSNAEGIRPAGESIRISAAQGFSGAPPEILAALIKASLSRRQRKARAAVMAYVAGEDYAETSMGFELAADLPQPDVRGRHHDLAESFARVNAEYFGGRLTPPRLTWSRNITQRLMGCYLAERDTLMISLTLDQAEVPARIVDFVMYHELLHRVLGVPLVDGRRRPHGPAFRAAEHQFEGHAAADAFLKRLSQGVGSGDRFPLPE